MGKRHQECQSGSYLEYAKITSFGSFANKVLGPFKPGLNVVYGPNEAGKTTISQFVRGVLFGWPRSGRNANSYRPEASERSGSLFFTDRVSRETTELKRVKNTDSVVDEFGVLEDIDVVTYDTMFSLTSDELMDLKSHDEVTSRLLTAGSGTSSSPAKALSVVEDRIGECLSRSQSKPDSLPNLRVEEARLKERVREGAEKAKAYRGQQRQLEDLDLRLATLAEAQETLGSETESLRAARYRVESIDERIDSAKTALAEAVDERRSCASSIESSDCSDDLFKMSPVDLSRIRDGLDSLRDGIERAEHSLQVAQGNETASRVAYEAVVGDPGFVDGRRRFVRQRRIRLVLVVVFCLAMVGLSSLLLMRSLDRLSVSMLVASVAFLVGALIVCAAGFAMNFKPSKAEEEMEDRLKKAEWVMRQDGLMKEECARALAKERSSLEEFLSNNHLAAAGSSLSRAYALLDEASAVLDGEASREQHLRSLDLQISSLSKEIESKSRERKELCLSLGLSPSATLADFDAAINQKSKERSKTINLVSETSRRCGELKRELESALGDWDFDVDKLALQQVETRLSEARDRLVTLLIAKESLTCAIAAWEKTSQPEVYRRASELLSLMTDGAWQRVFMDSSGKICVMDAVRTTREPRFLSTGTRQQLYLALRMALLMTADSVGRSLPVVCDDILVNFDAKRRKGAIKALAALAKKRQVILFTCHSDVAKQVGRLEPECNHIEL